MQPDANLTEQHQQQAKEKREEKVVPETEEDEKTNSLANNLHKLHPSPPIHLSPNSKRHSDPPAQVLALPLHLAENGHVLRFVLTSFTAASTGKRSLDLE